jgi:hypothetical protein
VDREKIRLGSRIDGSNETLAAEFSEWTSFLEDEDFPRDRTGDGAGSGGDSGNHGDISSS